MKVLLTLLAFQMLSAQAARDVIIDTDPGVDDALALLVALHSPELKIDGITVVAGNVPLSVGLRNALRLVEASHRADVPVAAGAAKPLRRKLATATYVHGVDGLGGAVIAEPTIRPVHETAVELIRRVVHAKPRQVTVIAIGPLTNIAEALQSDPALARDIQQIVLMGGALHGGNMTPVAEFNIYVDPEAARAVFHSGVPIVMSPWDASQDVVLTPEIAAGIHPNQPGSVIANAAIQTAKQRGRPGMTMFDPVAVAAFLDPSLVTTQKMYVDVETAGELTAGQTIGYLRAPIRGSVPLDGQLGSAVRTDQFKPNADVIVKVDSARFFQLMIERLNR
ncbi:MAG TPA: nucleoside hydrolase [Bryobacteraceae bacterium]|jgi:inosine-uridine nucleoside N-ribohydrolase